MAAWGLGVAWSAVPPDARGAPSREPDADVVGDSLGAGVGGEANTWPRLIANGHGVVVQDSRSGRDGGFGFESGRSRDRSGALVLAEIGGNDVLGGTSPGSSSEGLDALLRACGPEGRTVIMLELPLPPFSNSYGAIQRRLARRHGARLVPKRLLIGVLTTRRPTRDSIHLTEPGHALMAETILDILEPAFGREALGAT